MAEIRAEPNESKVWLWVLLALVAVAFAWWLFGRGDSTIASGTTDSTAAAPAALSSEVTTDRSGVDDYLAWVDSSDSAVPATADLSHEYTATGVRQLAGAIASIAPRDSLGGAEVSEQITALNTLADRMQTEPQSLKHADLAHTAFESAAQLIEDVQRRSFPTAGAQATSVREAASGVTAARPLLEQRPEVDRFFTSAADAMRAMRQN